MNDLKKIFLNNIKSHKKRWDTSDNVLYDLCENHSEHSKKNAPWVRAKALIIGRVYATGIERHTKGGKGSEKPLERLNNFLIKNGRNIDKEIGKIKKTGKGSYKDCLKQVLKSHGKLVGLYQKTAGNKKHSTRSFWSKYLHFHVRLVPIYDSRVTNHIKKYFSKNRELNQEFKAIKGVEINNIDRSYENYVKKFYIFSNSKNGLNLSDKSIQKNVKEIDYFLLNMNP